MRGHRCPPHRHGAEAASLTRRTAAENITQSQPVSHPVRPPAAVSRRSVMAGGLRAALLVACGRESRHRAAASAAVVSSRVLQHSLVAFFGGPDALRAGIAQRVTFGLADSQGALINDGPENLDF